jgi:hypothetical protein
MSDAQKAEILGELIEEAESRLADLRRRIELEEHYLDDLNSRRKEFGASGNGDADEPAKLTDSEKKPLPEAIVYILRAKGRAMRARDIAAELERQGYSTATGRGMLPNALSALGRRTDLFSKKQRGIYTLRKSGVTQDK